MYNNNLRAVAILDDFIGYLVEWEEEVNSSSFPEGEKPLMYLSQETENDRYIQYSDVH